MKPESLGWVLSVMCSLTSLTVAQRMEEVLREQVPPTREPTPPSDGEHCNVIQGYSGTHLQISIVFQMML